MRSLDKKISVVLLTLALLLLTGCGMREKAPKLERYSDSFFGAFDCTVTVLAYCESQEQFDLLLREVKDEYMRYHRLYDIYSTYPGIVNMKTVNDNAGIAPQKVGSEITELLRLAKEMYSATSGRVNIAMGSVLKIWHDVREYSTAFPENALLPDETLLEEASKHCNIDDLLIDAEEGTVYLADGEMRLDVGAIAKGYATECVAKKLLDEGWTHVSLNAGGNVRVLGEKPDGSAWNVGIIDPDVSSAKDYADAVALKSGSVITSGVYQRFFTYDGRQYHHIIDPDTLFPEMRYLSVTVMTGHSGEGDALSTALFNMDLDSGRKFVEEHEGVEALWILPDNSREYSSGFTGSY